MKYTFGTSTAAAARLEEIARYFNPLASSLVKEYAPDSPDVAVDIGCGPGFTTDMLCRSAQARETYGLDNSADFLALAESRFSNCRFLKHDITTIPFPVQADVMYGRFILSHLQNPANVIRKWATQLTVGGVLLVDELEAIDTDVDLFKQYLSMNDALIATQGANLFVGRELTGQDYGAKTLLDDCAILPVLDSQAAKWFLPNTETIWRQDPFILGRLTLSEIESISNALRRLADSDDPQSHIVWKMRRIALRRNGSLRPASGKH